MDEQAGSIVVYSTVWCPDCKCVIPTLVPLDGSILAEPSNAELAAKLGLKTKAQRDFYEAVVIGSGPAGLTAALYMAREGMDTLVIEQAGLGGQVGITQTLDNFRVLTRAPLAWNLGSGWGGKRAALASRFCRRRWWRTFRRMANTCASPRATARATGPKPRSWRPAHITGG